MTLARARRPIVELLAVAAIVLGLIGMHSVSVSVSGHGDFSAAAMPAAAMPAAAMAAAPVPVTNMESHAVNARDSAASTPVATGSVVDAQHGALGGDSHAAMLGMVCVMALLTFAVLLLLGRVRVSLDPGQVARVRAVVLRPARVFAGHPPSLVELSISRT